MGDRSLPNINHRTYLHNHNSTAVGIPSTQWVSTVAWSLT